MVKNTIPSHANTAIVAIVVSKKKVLLLKRSDPPLNWCPPCGRVELGETLAEALHREVKEEAGLNVDIGKYVFHWNGKHDGKEIESYSFICFARSEKVILSEEHSDFSWVKISELPLWQSKTDFELEKWAAWIAVAKEDLSSKKIESSK